MEGTRVRRLRPDLDEALTGTETGTGTEQPGQAAERACPDAEVEEYWAAIRALRAERDRLRRAG